MRGLRDRSGRLIFEGASDEHALAGHDVTLSIDEGIQHVAERELDAAMRTYETKGGSLVVVDPDDRRDPRARQRRPGTTPTTTPRATSTRAATAP